MSLFDAYLMVDWSSNSTPKQGADSIWLGWMSRDQERTETANPRTRAEAKALVLDLLLQWSRQAQRVLVGFDFSYAYPRGTAAALGLTGAEPWRQVWELLSSRLQDEANNRNNRFKVAAELNARMGANLFWGCPPNEASETLQVRKSPTPASISLYRLTEEALRHRGRWVQDAFKLFAPGAVGGQMLTGIPVVHALRDHPDLASISSVWPLETGFTSQPSPETGPFILHAEIWPGILGALDEQGVSCRDEAQVRDLCRLFRDQDEAGQLHRLFERPNGLTDDQVRICETEESWTLGA
jgi:hypothetical protein